MSQSLSHAISDAPVKRAIISGNAGDVAVVAAVADKKIRVLAFYVRQGAAGTVRFESAAGGTALTGVMVTTTADLVVEGHFCPVGLFETVAGEALSIEAVTGAVMGYAVYQEIG
jgi:hypothetical protein